MFDEASNLVAHLNGMFALSPATVAEMNWRVGLAVASTVGIVLLTTALLYPTIIALFPRLSGLSIHSLIAASTFIGTRHACSKV